MSERRILRGYQPVREQLEQTVDMVAGSEDLGDYRHWLHETAKLTEWLIDGIEEAIEHRNSNPTDTGVLRAFRVLERLLKGRHD